MFTLPGYTDSVIFLGILALLNLEFWPCVKYSNEQVQKVQLLIPLHGI